MDSGKDAFPDPFSVHVALGRQFVGALSGASMRWKRDVNSLPSKLPRISVFFWRSSRFVGVVRIIAAD